MTSRILLIPRFWHFLFQTTALSVAAIAFVGCNSSEFPRAIVEGNVTYQGTPIERGMILFYPIEGTPGPVSSAGITSGKYTVTNKDGVPVGKHRVVIEAYKPPPAGSDPDAGAVQFLPEKYNRNTELTVEVSSDSDPVERNFELSL